MSYTIINEVYINVLWRRFPTIRMTNQRTIALMSSGYRLRRYRDDKNNSTTSHARNKETFKSPETLLIASIRLHLVEANRRLLPQ